MKSGWIKGILATAVGLGLTGCISHEETVYQDTERARVEFENDAAARVFYETLNARSGDQRKSETRTEVHIPIVFEHKRRVIPGANTVFNEAVAFCDTNRDGKISEAEARVFSENWRRH